MGNMIEPQIVSANLAVQTNFEDVKVGLREMTEKYINLVVTDENQKDMEKVLREVVSLRTSIQKFEISGRRKLKKPMDDFSVQCRELLSIVAKAEAPLREQLDVYERKRVEQLQEQIEREYAAKANTAGLREEFNNFHIPPKWLNKTQKWSDTCIEIDGIIAEAAARQKAEDDLKELRATRREMGEMYIEVMNNKYGLATPITNVFLTDRVLDLSKEEIKSSIENEALKRHKLEEAAKQTVKPKPVETPAAGRQEVQRIERPQEQDKVHYPKNMVVTLRISCDEDFEIVQEILDAIPPRIVWGSEIR